jgi:hypothetical protein
MKQVLFILLLVAISLVQTQAQESESVHKWGKIGLSYSSFGDNGIVQDGDLIGDYSVKGDFFYTLGLSYSCPLTKWLDFETGLEYSRYGVISDSYPDGRSHISKHKFSLIDIPLTLKANFLHYFFINAGPLLDLDGSANMPVDSQGGIGLVGGIGVKYDFPSGISVFVNPYQKIHSLIAFSDGNYPEHVFDEGIRIGITYNLGKVK